MATSLPRKNRQASSISLQTGIRAPRAAARCDSVAGTPGLGTIKSWAKNVDSRWPPSSRVMPAARSLAAASATLASVRSSVAVTRAPRAAQKSAVAMPVRASPTTNTRFPRSSIPGPTQSPSVLLLPQFQSRQRKQRENQRGNPKADDYLRFAPACQLKVVVQWRHAKNALPGEAIGSHLQNHGDGLNDENAADEKQEHFLFDDDGNYADGATQRKRANIPHENICGVRVVPKKAQRSANQRAAENCQFARVRDVLDVEIAGEARVAGEISQDGERACGDDGASDGQSVEAVGEIYGVR